MENDSPNLFDSEPVSVQLTVVDNHDDDILAKEIREFGDEVQQQNTVDEYRTDESDDENKDNGDTDKNQLAAHVEKSVKEVGIEDSIKTAKDVQHKGLPPGRVKLIMKMDPDVNIIAREAVYLVTKATVKIPILNSFRKKLFKC